MLQNTVTQALKAPGVLSANRALRSRLSSLLLADVSTVANYQKGVGQTDAGAGACSVWANQIGIAGSLTAAGAARPTIQADGSLLFDGISMFMQATFTFNQPNTIYLVFKQKTWVSNGRVFDGITTNSQMLFQITGTPKLQVFAGTASADNANLALDTYGVATVVFNGAGGSFKIDGTAALTGNYGANAAGGLTVARSGASASAYGNIQVKEIILRSVADSAATQAQIQALLKAIHGTP